MIIEVFPTSESTTTDMQPQQSNHRLMNLWLSFIGLILSLVFLLLVVVHWNRWERDLRNPEKPLVNLNVEGLYDDDHFEDDNFENNYFEEVKEYKQEIEISEIKLEKPVLLALTSDILSCDQFNFTESDSEQPIQGTQSHTSIIIDSQTGKKYLKKSVLEREAFTNEVTALQKLQGSRFVPQLLCYKESELMVVMEYFEGFQLRGQKAFAGEEAVIKDDEAFKKMAFEIISAVAEIHSKGILHNDLKLANILINPSNQIMIVDYGMAIELGKSGKMMKNLRKSAPEIFFGPNVDVAQPSIDWWPIGVKLHDLYIEFLCARTDVSDQVHIKCEDRQHKDTCFVGDADDPCRIGYFRTYFPKNFANLIGLLTIITPSERNFIGENLKLLLDHPYFL